MDYKLPGSSVHGVFQQEYYSGWPFPSPWDLPDPRIEPGSLGLWADSLPSQAPWKAPSLLKHLSKALLNIITTTFCNHLLYNKVKASACNAGDLSSLPGLGRSPGEGNENPLQYCCLENPVDGGAWWATVHRVAKSQTWLSDFTFTFLYNIRI